MLATVTIAALLAAAPLHEQSGQEARPPGTEVIERTTRTYSFTYTYPLEAAAIPALDALLRRDAREAEARVRGAAEELRAEAGNDPDILPHQFQQEWRVDAHLSELVALSASIFSFTGGAHGMSRYEQLLWDRSAGERIPFADLFSDPDAALNAMRPQFCALLDAERARRREGGEGRSDCPELADHPITLVTGPSGRIETLRVLIEPYAAGSYAEGTYEIDVPVSDEVLRLVRARFGAAFVFR
ncbi:MAG: DUF4163 domain-containing protein [Pseudomonadota bacterium]|nr:DUF4163 domain-containing protein [Pseudomonadota bacterium]